MSLKEIKELCEKGKKEEATEVLITLGENPEVYEKMEEKLKEWEYSSTVDYLVDIAKKILKSGLLPHINPGIVTEEDLKRLRPWSASMGLMLECTSELEAHKKSPGKEPEVRLEMLESGGKLKIPFTTGILVGIGESWEDRVKSLKEIKDIQNRYGHIQEVIIQPFIPKEGTPMADESPPNHKEILKTVSIAKKLLPNTKIQVPPNLIENISDYVSTGIDDFGGISAVTPDYVNPEKNWPDITELKRNVPEMGYKLRERLPIHPKFAKNPKFMSEKVRRKVDTLSDENGYRRT